MTDDVTFVVLTEAGNSFNAELTVGALRAHGILSLAAPDSASDEFRMSQNLLGRGHQVLVPANRLEEARSVLAELRTNPPSEVDIPWDEADDVNTAVAAEIAALHVEFEGWMRGTLESLERVAASFAPDFTFVSPQGDTVDGADILAGLEDAHGARQLRIEIKNTVVRHVRGDTIVATYEEWHTHEEYETARQSTAVLSRDESAPGGFRWHHVHETWKLPPPHRRLPPA